MFREPLKFKLSESVTKFENKTWLGHIYKKICDDKNIGFLWIKYLYIKRKQSKIENCNSLGIIIYWIELMSLYPTLIWMGKKNKKKKILESFESEKL